jgi:hypothetical protein
MFGTDQMDDKFVLAEFVGVIALLVVFLSWCFWQKDVRTRHLGIVAAFGGVAGFAFAVVADLWWRMEQSRRGGFGAPDPRTILEEFEGVLHRYDILVWRDYLRFAAVGMVVGFFSLLILGPFLIRRTAAVEPEPTLARPKKKTIAQLVDGITPENLHGK